MAKVNTGVEYEGIPNVTPGGRSIPKVPGRGRANRGGGTVIVPPTPTTPASTRASEMFLTADGFTQCVAGNGVRHFDLSTINTSITPVAFSYPGGATDDNNTQWLWLVPSLLNPTSTLQLKARLYLYIEDTGVTPGTDVVQLAYDSFTSGADVGLSSHTADTGQSWTAYGGGMGGTPGAATVSSGDYLFDLVGLGVGQYYATLAATPPSADYWARLSYSSLASGNGSVLGLVLREGVSGDGYFLGVTAGGRFDPWGKVADPSLAGFCIVKQVGGVLTQLAWDNPVTPASSGQLKGLVSGSTLQLYYNGGLVLGAIDGGISATRLGGVFQLDVAGVPHIDDFYIEYTGAVDVPATTEWQLYFSSRETQELLSTAYFGNPTVYGVPSGPGQAGQIIILESNVIDIAGVSPGDLCDLKLRRYGGNTADTLDGRQVAIGVQLSWGFPSNSNGQSG